ncbi:hypothetical protein [Clostridium sp. DJ247]|uniref:hypothetical protein n=1 Tax=Clostridium sp. DJ247 TaxID=2726188 RepID=UPI001627F2EB|nr:hypothetical protein [Clostridium sp. DJ247]MBC2582397.1 hypothetical protein [Clostridium sp. DJ247]
MKRLMLIIICFMLSFTIGFVSAKSPFHVYINDKEVKNKGYIIKDNKIYISEDVLKEELSLSISHDKSGNEITIYDLQKAVLEEKNILFEKFAQEYKPESPDEVAELWAKGIKQRNGIIQYLVLSKSLKEELKKIIGKQSKNSWITESTNIEIKDYNITRENLNKSTWKYKIDFTTTTGNNEHNATLIIGKEDSKWRVVDIEKNFDI